MKKLIPFFLLLILTSCGSVGFTVSTMGHTPVQWVEVYDFDRIHWLYTNHPSFVWGNYYSHPYFIRYRTECLQRGIYVRPYRYNRVYRQPQRRVVHTPTTVRRNSGRSNYQYRTRSNNTQVHRTAPVRQNYNRGNSTHVRTNRSTQTKSRSNIRSVPRRSSSGRSNQRINE